MSYEKELFDQAELRIVRGSTIERKQMSTKTTFKRISLVTVAALCFGLLAAVPSIAAAASTTVVKVGPGAAGDGAPGTAQDIYTSLARIS